METVVRLDLVAESTYLTNRHLPRRLIAVEPQVKLRGLWTLLSMFDCWMPFRTQPFMTSSRRKTSASSSTSGGSSKTQQSPGPSAVSKSSSPLPPQTQGAAGGDVAKWTFLTNHAHVLILLASNPDMVLRTVALRVGITERAVQRIIADLEEGGCIERQKIGRRNRYRIHPQRPLRHPIESHRSIGDLLNLIAGSTGLS